MLALRALFSTLSVLNILIRSKTVVPHPIATICPVLPHKCRQVKLGRQRLPNSYHLKIFYKIPYPYKIYFESSDCHHQALSHSAITIPPSFAYTVATPAVSVITISL